MDTCACSRVKPNGAHRTLAVLLRLHVEHLAFRGWEWDFSAVDFDRYYQAFPALKANTQPALSPEDKLQPGEEVKRTVIVGFPVTLENFNQRRSVSVVIQPYDQPVPVTLTK